MEVSVDVASDKWERLFLAVNRWPAILGFFHLFWRQLQYSDWARDVFKFHIAAGIPSPCTPTIPPEDRTRLRIRLIDEEVNRELIPALEADDLTAIADGAADAIVVIIGTCLEYGIPIGRVLEAVNLSNLEKIDPETGRVLLRDDGKILKPPDWTPPDIAGILGI